MKSSNRNYEVLLNNKERATRYYDNYHSESKKKIFKYIKYIKYCNGLLKDYKKNIILDKDNKIYQKDTLEFKNKINLLKININNILLQIKNKINNKEILKLLKNIFFDIETIIN